MKENGLYVISDSYFEKFTEQGCCFKHNKKQNRPIFCCIQDHVYDMLFWAIPLSEITQDKIDKGQVDRVNKYIRYPEGTLGWAFYHIAKTNVPAIFNISSTFPITDKYVDREWLLNGTHFIVPQTSNIPIIRRKLGRILSEERHNPNKFEQHITDIKETLLKEILCSE